MSIRGLDNWLRKLTRQDMPVVGAVIAELNTLTGQEDAQLSQLAEVILRDPNLTSHVLRVANSVHYNFSKCPINTVSRAIVLIGLKGMRAICISLLLIESLLSRGPKDRLLQVIAEGLHAATQARDLIKMYDESIAEEAFIAALLFHLGEMAFLANTKITDDNAALLDSDLKVRQAAMEDVLGTSFKAISRGLAKHWRLGDVLTQSLYPGNQPSLPVRAVLLGERISHASLEGWDSEAMTLVLADLSEFTEMPPEQCLKLVQESAESAAEVALRYGAPQVCPLIPGKNYSAQAPVEKREDNGPKVLSSDPQLQLNILRELSIATAEQADVNTIFQMVIEGMHRGIGIERVTVAFILNHRARAKYVLGEGTETWRGKFDFDVSPYADNIFTYATEQGCVWLDDAFMRDHPALLTADVKRLLGGVPAFIYVLRLGARRPALFYADRADYGGELTNEQFESFRHFASQAQLSLNLVSKSMGNRKTRNQGGR